MRCPKCGCENPEENKFCRSCGASLQPQSPRQPQPEQDPPLPEGIPPSDPDAGYIIRRADPKERSRPMQAVSAVIRVLLYVGVLFGCQSCVISGYTANQMMASGVPASMETVPEEYLMQLLEDVNQNMTLILLISNLLAVLVVCLLFRLRHKEPKAEMGVYFVNPLRLPLFALFGSALNVFWSLLLPLLPLPESLVEIQNAQYDGLVSGGSLALEILSVGLVAGIAEELIFRGIAMTRFEPIGTAFAVVASSVIFAVSHGSPIAVLYALSIGLLFAGLFHRYGSVIPGIVCHIFFNIANYWVPEEGSPVLPFLFALSILIILPCFWLFYIRRPSFFDAVNDMNDRMPLRDEEHALVRRFREEQKQNGIDIDAAARYEEEWKEMGKKNKENRE